ncbi:MAG: hypothetical protein HOE53_02090 [Candidatus Magasanikbacteria bacterium]|nr:hypothetical protein [Candidatus Magasanikbacteria bacterium]
MHIHFIGICGVAMSALAIAFHKKGYTVTGSDKGFYPPISTHLKEAGVQYYPGWHPEKMTAHGDPDLVIVGNVAGSKNPEWVYVQEQGVPYLSYPEALAKFFIQEHSIVCAGTYGKTTSTTLLSWIFLHAKRDPSYMFGGLIQTDLPAASIGTSDWSIVEGDEYKSARWDNRAKFYHYKPTHLLLTAVEWDHADVYPTEELYMKAFEDLVDMIPENGLIVYSDLVPERIANRIKKRDVKTITYGATGDAAYSEATESLEGMQFTLTHAAGTSNMQTTLFGAHNAHNFTGCYALAEAAGIDSATIIEAIASFPGIKRRLERKPSAERIVFDDIAHSPAKATSTLKTLKSLAPGKLIAVFEPNTGNRQQEALPGYTDAFTDADTVLIPRLTRVKQDPTKPTVLNGEELAEIIAKSHPNVLHINDDEEVTKWIVTNAGKEDIVTFLGSHGFRGMIDSVL